jgi:signal transduction histidine kinase
MHEIRNPLEALGNLTFLTQEEAYDPDKVIQYMQMAKEQMATLTRIVSHTLGCARTSCMPTSSDLSELAESALRIHQKAISTKRIHLVKDFPDGLTARIHMGEILQVVSNLIVNALDALPPDGTLSVRLRRRKDNIFIVVSDNGQGIPAEHTRTIFEPFFTTKEENGTGLGLALSQDIVHRHGGRIGVRSSVRPGKSGTTFRVSIPA